MVWSLWFCGVGALCAGACSILGDGLCTARLRARSFTSDSCSSWGTDIESCCAGSEKKSQLWNVFRENFIKNFLKEPRTGFGTSMHLCGKEWSERGGSIGHTRASMYFRDDLFSLMETFFFKYMT